jgi:hypothetical protein
MWGLPLKQSYRSVTSSNKMLWAVEAQICQPHLKSKVQSEDSDSVSDERGSGGCLGPSSMGPMHAGSPPRAKRLLCGASPTGRLQTANRGFTLCLRDWILTALAYKRFQNNSFKLENEFHWEN